MHVCTSMYVKVKIKLNLFWSMFIFIYEWLYLSYIFDARCCLAIYDSLPEAHSVDNIIIYLRVGEVWPSKNSNDIVDNHGFMPVVMNKSQKIIQLFYLDTYFYRDCYSYRSSRALERKWQYLFKLVSIIPMWDILECPLKTCSTSLQTFAFPMIIQYSI